MSPDDTHTDAAPLLKVRLTRAVHTHEAEDLPSSSPCLLSSGEQDIDPNYLPDYSRELRPGS